MKKEKFNRNTIGILLDNSLHSIITLFVNTFLVAYILNISLGNFYNVALYYLIAYLTMIVSYPIFSILAKKVNSTYLLRISSFLYSPILIVIAFLKDDVVNYIIPISISYYLVQSLFWCSNNNLISQKIKGSKLKSYSTYNTIFKNLISIIVPIIFGRIIDLSSLQVIAITVVILSIIEIASTFLIDKANIENKKFDLKGFYNNCYKSSNKKSFNYLYIGEILNGFKFSVSTLVTILIVLTFKTNTSLGIINSVISIITMLVLYFTNKISFNKLYKWYLPITLIVSVSVLCLLFNINKPLIIFFNVCYNSLLAIVLRSYDVRKHGLIKAINKEEYILENQAIVEMCLNIGRLIFYITLISVSMIEDIMVYKLLLAISLVGLALFGIVGYLADKEYEKVLIQRAFNKNNKLKEE